MSTPTPKTTLSQYCRKKIIPRGKRINYLSNRISRFQISQFHFFVKKLHQIYIHISKMNYLRIHGSTHRRNIIKKREDLFDRSICLLFFFPHENYPHWRINKNIVDEVRTPCFSYLRYTQSCLSLPPSLLSPAESTQQRDVTRRDTDIYDSWCAPYPLS